MLKNRRFFWDYGKTMAMLTLVLGALASPAVFALDTPVSGIAEDLALRLKLFDAWFIETPSRVTSRPALLEVLPGGGRVEVRTERIRDEFGIVLAREFSRSFPGWAQGSWVITRSMKDGSLVRIRFFPRSDPYTYIQFYPLDGERSLMDVIAYDAYLARSVVVPLSLEHILSAPLQEVLRTLKQTALVRYFEPHPEDYQNIRALLGGVRRLLPGLSFADDGAINENGEYVFIKTLEPQKENFGLNCSGFVKWLVDGLLRPVTGRRLPIFPLKQRYGERGSSFTEPYEQSRDPFFGLDWIRNLASAVGLTLKSPAFTVLDEIEVRECPFSEVIVRTGRTSRTVPYTGFLPDAGFDIKNLKALLYTLAINEPDTVYLGAVNAELPPKPRTRQYFHVAAFFPYFDGYGTFHILVFESAAETPFNRFVARYPVHHVNLVRIPVETAFDP
ncbi:MAG: hypothetical protein LBP37_01705 [Spirochaetaceae bacterium]|jgi:hypothetical protein|nr:hypothetical protein [Spirochaetaceae bacterium]